MAFFNTKQFKTVFLCFICGITLFSCASTKSKETVSEDDKKTVESEIKSEKEIQKKDVFVLDISSEIGRAPCRVSVCQ